MWPKLLLLSCLLALANAACENQTWLDDHACLPETYNAQQPPETDGDAPIDVEVAMKMIDMLNIDDHQQTLKFVLEFGLGWDEPRLEMNRTGMKKDRPILFMGSC